MCKIITTKEALELSKQQLEEEIDKYSEYLKELTDILKDKEVNEFEWGSKYIKICGNDEAVIHYMKCESAQLDKSHMHARPCIWFHGVGFNSEFGPYIDCNYVEFSTSADYYLHYAEWCNAEKSRKAGIVQNTFKVDIITKEEYEKAFYKMINNSKECFFKWK